MKSNIALQLMYNSASEPHQAYKVKINQREKLKS
jgi:hypothetical protein